MPYFLTKNSFISAEPIGRKRHAMQQLAKVRQLSPEFDWQIIYRPSTKRPSTTFGRRAA